MKKRMLVLSVVGAVLVLAVAGVALAAVTFDPSTGMGFVGKGDVQTAIGWNNAQLQNNLSSVTFSLDTVDTYEVVNAWATGNPDNPISLNSHTETVSSSVQVNAAVAYDGRRNSQNQITGINLTGLGTTTVIGTIPVVSATVTYVTFPWTTTEWDGTYDTVPNPNYNGHNSPTIQVKHYVDVTHTSDQVPVDENGELYTEGNNKAVLSVTLLDSVGGLHMHYNGQTWLWDGTVFVLQ